MMKPAELQRYSNLSRIFLGEAEMGALTSGTLRKRADALDSMAHGQPPMQAAFMHALSEAMSTLSEGQPLSDARMVALLAACAAANAEIALMDHETRVLTQADAATHAVLRLF
ncbi:MAG: hypothetical protein KGQ41_01780 [Alphaproteobacteria bacterium]|nr:hypothetical protein [Alphaproteobacteria bacterium]